MKYEKIKKEMEPPKKIKYLARTYRLSEECVNYIETLSRRFREETGFSVAQGKIIEMAVTYIKDASLRELLD